MKRPGTMQAHQLRRFARFLEEHPGFSPLLMGENALVCGFQVGGRYLRNEQMERLIATEPRFDAQEAALLQHITRQQKDSLMQADLNHILALGLFPTGKHSPHCEVAGEVPGDDVGPSAAL